MMDMNESKEKAFAVRFLAESAKGNTSGEIPCILCPHSIKELEELP